MLAWVTYASDLGMAKDLPIQSLADWASLRPELQDALLRADITTTTVFHHAFDGSDVEANQFAEELGGVGQEDGAVLLALWKQACAYYVSRVRFVSKCSSSDAAVHVMQQQRVQERMRLRLDLETTSSVGGSGSVGGGITDWTDKVPVQIEAEASGSRRERGQISS